MTGVQFFIGARYFPYHQYVQTEPEGHPPSHSVDNGPVFPEVKLISMVVGLSACCLGLFKHLVRMGIK